MTFDERIKKLNTYESKQALVGRVFDFEVDLDRKEIIITKYYDAPDRTEVVIPKFVDKLDEYIFYGAKYIKKIIMGDNVKEARAVFLV